MALHQLISLASEEIEGPKEIPRAVDEQGRQSVLPQQIQKWRLILSKLEKLL